MFLLKVAFRIVLEEVSPGSCLFLNKGLDVFKGIVLLEDDIMDMELTAGFSMPRILARAIPFQKSGK